MKVKEFFRDVNRASKDIADIYKDEVVGMFKWFTYAFWYVALTITYGIAMMFPKDNNKEDKK